VTTELATGTVVAERYQLERLLGEGGMGAVWAGIHLITRKRVALKFLKGHAGPDNVRRFMREARAVSSVNHPNVVSVHDVFQLEDGSPVMVMDFLTGESLAQRLDRERALPLGDVARILLPVTSAVATAHAAGIVHRDLKPDNIMLHARADGEIEPKVLDFGIAKLNPTEGTPAAATADLTQTGAMMGTPSYMAPEQVFGEKDVDHRADIWAMGVIIYECLAGERPFVGENFGQLIKAIATRSIIPLEQAVPGLPEDVTALVAALLASDRNKRPQDLRTTYEVLKRYTSVQAISFAAPRVDAIARRAVITPDSGAVSATSKTELVESQTRPRRAIWPYAAGAVVVVLGAGALVSLTTRGDHGGAGSVPSEAGSSGAPPNSVPSAQLAATSGTAVATTVVVNARDGGVPQSHPATPAKKSRSHPASTSTQPAVVTPPRQEPTPVPTAKQKLPGSVVDQVPF
jgi:serine/threonine protein kinase